MTRYIESSPYAWPYNGDLRPENTALIIMTCRSISVVSAAMLTRWAMT